MASNFGAQRRRIDSAPRDLVNELPSNVVDNIMGRLPLLDATRLCVLTRKSRSIWMSLPYLKFDSQFFQEVLKNAHFQTTDWYNLVTKVLLSHRGPVHQFVLHIPDTNATSGLDIGSIITFLSNNGVKEITIENGRGSFKIKLPSHLFSCGELENLKLSHFSFSIPPTFKGYKNLTRIYLENVIFTGDGFESFISGCPVLESLTLNKFRGVDHLTINAPSLEHIKVYAKFKSICLKGCIGLSSVTIGLLEKVANYDHLDPSAREHVATTARDLVELLHNSCTIKELYLGAYFFKFLARPCLWGMLDKPFKNLRKLRLSNVDLTSRMFTTTCATSMIERCPNLEELTISFASGTLPPKCKIFHDLGEDRFPHLRIIYLLSVRGLDVEFNLIRPILSASPALQKIYFQRHVDAAARELRWYFPLPPEAEIIFLEPQIENLD